MISEVTKGALQFVDELFLLAARLCLDFGTATAVAAAVIEARAIDAAADFATATVATGVLSSSFHRFLN